MIHFRNIIIPFAAVFFFLMAGCHHDSVTMQELARIDTMVYHYHEQEALPLLQQMNTAQFSKEERAYHAVLLSMALYKNYILNTSHNFELNILIQMLIFMLTYNLICMPSINITVFSCIIKINSYFIIPIIIINSCSR